MLLSVVLFTACMVLSCVAKAQPQGSQTLSLDFRSRESGALGIRQGWGEHCEILINANAVIGINGIVRAGLGRCNSFLAGRAELQAPHG
jgi:hypothetical protein